MEEVLKETIESYNTYIDKLESGIEAIINLIHNEEFNKAKENLVNLLEGLLWLMEINHRLSLLNQKCFLDMNKLNEIIREVVEAIENNDLNLCADILEYELKNQVKLMGKFEMSRGEKI